MPETADSAPTFLAGRPLARRAFELAKRAHGQQRREWDAAPFIVHPLEVASLLANTGHCDRVVAAGILHDVVEDSPTGVQEIARQFGAEIAELVAAMTEDDSIQDYRERKAALREQIAARGPDAAAVYAADKLAKVRELRNRAARGEHVLDAASPARLKLEHYISSLAMLEELAPAHPLVRQLRFELEVLHALPPRPDLIAR